MLEVDLLSSRHLPLPVVLALPGLLRRAFAGDFSADDLAHALGGEHAVLREHGRMIAHGALVPRRIVIGERPYRAGYVEAVAVRPDRQGRGLGRAVMERLAARIRDAYEIGVLSTGAPGFYARLGWERWRGPSFVVAATGERRRTPDEDDGLMVLRAGPGAALDLTLAISCAERAGDCW